MELVFLIASSLLLAVFVIAVTVHLAKFHAVAAVRKVPGPKPNWLLGNALHLAREPDELLTQILGFSNQYSKEGIFCLWIGATHPIVFLFKPELVEDLLNSSKHIGKSSEYTFLHPWLGTAITTLPAPIVVPMDKTLLTSSVDRMQPQGTQAHDGSKWKTRRRQITPTFHFRILNDFIEVFEEQAAIMVSCLKKRVHQGVFNIMPFISRCALDTICLTSMGSSPNAQENANSQYVSAVVRDPLFESFELKCFAFHENWHVLISELVQLRQRSPWLWNDFLYFLMPSGREHNKCLKILHDFTNKVIDERIAERALKTPPPQINDEEKDNDEGNMFTRKKRLAFLDLLLEAYDNGEISREGVREEVDTFMFEGHDTTSAGITWTLYLLSRHPEIQQRVHDEVDSFFAQRPGTLTVEDFKKLRYLECVIKEALRLFPPVPFLGRTASEDYQLNGYVAPKGTTVATSVIALHRNPDVWSAPLEFDPDRFLPENSQGRHPFAYIPFSAGQRNCIGQRFALLEEKIVLSNVLRNFCIESTQTFDELHVCSELVTRPREGIFVTLGKRF